MIIKLVARMDRKQVTRNDDERLVRLLGNSQRYKGKISSNSDNQVNFDSRLI